MNELATINNYCELGKTNLSFKREITKDEWINVFKALKQVEGCVQFWIGDCLAYRQQKWGMYEDIAEETGYDKGTLRNIKNVSENIENARRHADLSFSHHQEVVFLSPEKQELFLNKAVEEKLSVRELREEIRRFDIERKYAKLPESKFRVIYADPPWEYSNSMPGYFKEQADHYQLMSINELSIMNIKDISEENAILFIWVTSPILEDSLKVIKSWGFEYKTSFVWDKVKHNMGHYNSIRHEFLFVCTRGSCTPDVKKLFDSVIVEERTEHSKKPEIFRQMIDELYPYGKRIELFARTKIDGWEIFGNET